VMMVLFGISTSLAYSFTVGGIYYNKSGTNATVTYKSTSYNSYSGSVIIPPTVTLGNTTYTVIGIGSRAFYGCSGLTSVVIPSSITSIGDDAFVGCSRLTSVTIPNSVRTIGYSAFSGCSGLTGTLTIPNSVTSIGYKAFNSCSGLTSASIGNSVTSIGSNAFLDCSGLTSITVSSGNTVYDSREGCNAIIETESNKLLFGCMNTIIPNTVTTLGARAFQNCTGLTSITIPENITAVKDSVFYACTGLTRATIGNSQAPNGDVLTTIGNHVFRNCSALVSVTIGNSVRAIGNYVFYGCSALANATIGNSVNTIGTYAFYGCSELNAVTIGSAVNTIGNYSFYGCSALQTVTCLATTPPTIQEFTFNPYPDMLYVPMESVDAYNRALYWRSFGNISGIVPGYNTFVVDGIYYSSITGNTAMVIANENVEGYYTGNVVIPSTVTYQGMTFDVVAIDDNAFDGCYDLASVVIGENVTAIGEQAFQGCVGLTSVTIGSNVASIASKAFNYCNALTTVTCLGTVPPVMASSDCFSNVAYNRAKLMVPRDYIEDYQAADYWYRFATIEGVGDVTPSMGDMNGDGRITISDVTTLIDTLLTTSDYYEYGDLNGNGRLDIGDVTSLIDFLLRGDN